MNKFLPIGAATINGILVGAAMVATRLVIEQTSPASLALLRYLIGLMCLLPPAFIAARVRLEPRDRLPIAILGITQFGVVVTLLNYALQFIPAGRAALLFATFPLQTLIIAAILGSERITPAKLLGVLLTIIGVGFALGEKVLQAGSGSNWVGELAVIASAFSGALCSVLYRPYLKKYPPLALSTFAMFAAVIALAALAAGEGFFNAFPVFTLIGWLAIIFIGISSGVGYYLWLWALKHTTPTRVTVFLALSPITATILGAVLLAENITAIFLLGLGCVAAGLVLATTDVRNS